MAIKSTMATETGMYDSSKRLPVARFTLKHAVRQVTIVRLAMANEGQTMWRSKATETKRIGS